MLTDFHNSFTARLSGKLATKSYLHIPPHLEYVATLPSGIWMSEKWIWLSKYECQKWLTNTSLNYLVKYLSSKDRRVQEVIEANCHVRLMYMIVWRSYIDLYSVWCVTMYWLGEAWRNREGEAAAQCLPDTFKKRPAFSNYLDKRTIRSKHFPNVLFTRIN